MNTRSKHKHEETGEDTEKRTQKNYGQTMVYEERAIGNISENTYSEQKRIKRTISKIENYRTKRPRKALLKSSWTNCIILG